MSHDIAAREKLSGMIKNHEFAMLSRHADYWDSSSCKRVQPISLARERATGTAPRGIGQHAGPSR